MERFKAVEKEMKTKAFSKEGLSASAKLSPEEQAKADTCDFLSEMVGQLEQQIEALEAEETSLLATTKKGKKDTGKTDRLGEIHATTERHKWHQAKLEQALRLLENGDLEVEQITEIEDGIKYYVEENQSIDFNEDEGLYEDLNLEDDEGGLTNGNDNDKVSSQDAQSVQDEISENTDGRSAGTGKPKSTSMSEPPGAAARRPSNAIKSPLPALATLHTPLPTVTNGAPKDNMKPAPLPTRPPGETLKYASAAAAAAASDKNNVGIAPLPPPPAPQTQMSASPSSLPAPSGPKSSTATSPDPAPSIPAPAASTSNARSSVSSAAQNQSPAAVHAQPKSSPTARSEPIAIPRSESAKIPSASQSSTDGTLQSVESKVKTVPPEKPVERLPPGLPRPSTLPKPQPIEPPQTNGDVKEEEESVFHLPLCFQDLVHSYEATKSRATSVNSPAVHRLLNASHMTRPNSLDADKPRHYRPEVKFKTPSYYPQEPFPDMDDPSLYSKVDTDTLFYVFYYRQNTYQQYMAAKTLKSQSWRFHKQYQTWFQRHEEPKTITEEYEQGTYRFFDYESTWSVME